MSRTLSVLALLPILGGCDLFTAEANLDNVCMQLDDRIVDGAPGGKIVRTVSYDDLSIFDGFISLDAKVTDLRVALKATQGVSNLSFLDSVHVTITSGTLPPLELLACDGGACASSTKETTVAIDAPDNLIDYALNGTMKIALSVSGPLPTSDWMANVQVCLSGTAQLKIGF
jgi:hypothetical protein